MLKLLGESLLGNKILQSQSITPPLIINYKGKKGKFIVEKLVDTTLTM